MSRVLMLKSRVAELCDYRSVDVAPFVADFQVDQERLERDMERRRSARGTLVDAPEAAPGDMVTLSCTSEDPRFCKEGLVLVAGRGLFDRALEEQLTGLAVGGEYDLTVRESAVHVKLLAAKRRVAAPLTGEETARLRRECIDRQAEAFLDEDAGEGALSQVSQAVIERCTFDFDEGEVALVREAALRKAEELLSAQAQQEDGEAPAGEEEQDMAPEQFRELFVNMQMFSLKAAVIGHKLLADQGRLPTVKDYEADLLKYAPAGADLDEERQKYPPIQFLLDHCSEYYCRQIDAYTCQTLKDIANR